MGGVINLKETKNEKKDFWKWIEVALSISLTFFYLLSTLYFFLCFIGFDVDINIINTYHFFIVVTELGDR